MAQLELLIESLRRLPGVGPKAAQRIAYHLLQHDRSGADQLGRALCNAVMAVQHCQRCNTFTEQDICLTCRNPKRNATQLCVVETPADQNVIESSHGFNGLYYVLLGRLSPLDGVGPESLKFNQLLKRADDGVVKEVILATSFTTEGETTAHYLGQALRHRGIRCTRLARGVPVGSELEYVDAGTVAYALLDRRES